MREVDGRQRVRRGAIALAAAVGCATTAAGCASELAGRNMTVLFRTGATVAQEKAASQACAHVEPEISPIPVPTPSGNISQLAGNQDQIEFHIGGADDHDVAQVTDCLEKQPGVLGVQPPDDDMS